MLDSEIKIRGFELLARSLGLVDAERFICLIQRERFDYTKWRQKLFEGFTAEEISRQAMIHQHTTKGKQEHPTATANS